MRLPIGLLPALLLAVALGVWAAVDVAPVVRVRAESKLAADMRSVARTLTGVLAEVGATVESFGEQEVEAARAEATKEGIAPAEMETHLLGRPRVGSIIRLRNLFWTTQAGSGFLIREIEAAARDVDAAETPEREQAVWQAFAESVRPIFGAVKLYLTEMRTELAALAAPPSPSVDKLLQIIEAVGL